jgi:deferrochelatase/peroxidase EfeB
VSRVTEGGVEGRLHQVEAGPTAAAAALVGVADPDFAGGSYVIVQKYLHDMRAWPTSRCPRR